MNKKARLFLRAFLEVLSFVLALAAAFAFMVLGGTLFDICGFMAFGAIEVFFFFVWVHYETLKKSEL